METRTARSKIFVLISALGFAFAGFGPWGIHDAQALELLDQEQTQTTVVGALGTPLQRFFHAQTFTVGISGYLTAIEIMDVSVQAIPCLPDVELVVDLFGTDASGRPVGPPIASRSFTAAEVGVVLPALTSITAHFGMTSIPVTVGDRLAIVVYNSEVAACGYFWGIILSDVYAGGAVYRGNNTVFFFGPHPQERPFRTYVSVVTPDELLEELQAEVEALDAKQGVRSSLTGMLNGVRDALAAGDDGAAHHHLDKFIKKVNDWLKKGDLIEAEANNLIVRAEEIKDLL